MPHGGRLLGLFGSRTDENFLWTNPALDAVGSAQALFESVTWHNSGGDRTWVSPELDFFFPKYPDLSVYRQPPELDPGNYTLVESRGRLGLKNQFTLSVFRSGGKCELKIIKSFDWAPSPIRDVETRWLQNVDYAGYTLSTSLEFTNFEFGESTQVSIWNLLQMPIGGQLLVPTYKRCAPTLYMGKVDSHKLTIGERITRVQMRGPGVTKLGFASLHSTGRVGYLYSVEQEDTLVVRNFCVNPSGNYVDAPRNQPTRTGDAVQSCCVDSTLGQFSELEYHTPAIGRETGRTRCEDASQVWAFRGPRSQIQIIAELLLGKV